MNSMYLGCVKREGSKVETAPMLGQFLEEMLFLYQVGLVCSSVARLRW